MCGVSIWRSKDNGPESYGSQESVSGHMPSNRRLYTVLALFFSF